MSEHTTETERLAREKAAYAYSSALERGDFDVVAGILAQAEQDPELERLLLEINRAQQRELEQQQARQQVRAAFEHARRPRAPRLVEWWRRLLARWPVVRPLAWGGLGVVLILIVAQLITPIPETNTSSEIDISQLNRARYGLNGVSYSMAVKSTWPSLTDLFDTDADEGVDVPTQRERAAYYFDTSNLAVSKDGLQPALGLAWNASDPQALPPGRMIVRTGKIEMTVNDTRQARVAVENLVGSMANEGAYIVSAIEYNAYAEMQPAIAMQIRVPVAKFDSTIQGVGGLAVEVLDRSETAQDVTEEYSDLDTKLESLETARLRLVELMGSAGKVSDLLEVEKQLTERETEIAAIKGRMLYLEKTAALSSLAITLYPDTLQQPIPQGWRPQETARIAYEQFIRNMQRFVDWLIYFGIVRLPWLAVIGLVAWVAWRIIRRAWKKRKQ